MRGKVMILIASGILAVVCGAFAEGADPAEGPRMNAEKKAMPLLLSFKMNRIDGTEVNLSDYLGKVVLFVNVASRCGFTPQYAGLQALHEKYADKGLAIIGIPANDFGGQEPGSNDQISTFCKKEFNVQFDMLAKVHVVGDEQVDLYKALTSTEHNAIDPGPVKWNFEKFLLDRQGKLVGRFRSSVAPLSPDMIKAIEAALEAAP